MAHVEDRWTVASDRLDTRGRVIREHTDRYGIGKRWLANWTEAGQRKSQSFETKDAATAHIGTVTKAQREGRHIAAHRMTVAEFGDEWITTQIHQRASTRQQMEIRWRRHIRPELGPLLIAEVTPMHVQAAVLRWRDEGHAAATIAVSYGYTAAIFKSAIRARLRLDTPCDGINLPRQTHERVIPLTTGQVLTIADRITPRYRSLVLLGAATGMRSGELRGLTVDRLRWDDHLTVRIDRQLTDTAPTWGPPKTSKSDRAVSVDDTAAGMLAYHMLRWPPHESGLIFTGRENGPLARTSIATAWSTATRGMDLPDRSGLHQLRHFHASLLIAAGLSVTAVAERLGHQDSTETLKTYAHLWPNDEARSRDAIALGLWG